MSSIYTLYSFPLFSPTEVLNSRELFLLFSLLCYFIFIYLSLRLYLKKLFRGMAEQQLTRVFNMYQRKFKLVKRRELSSYEILAHHEMGFRGFTMYICLMFLADLNPLKSTFFL